MVNETGVTSEALFYFVYIYMDKSLQQQSKKELAEMNVIGKTGTMNVLLVLVLPKDVQ